MQIRCKKEKKMESGQLQECVSVCTALKLKRGNRETGQDREGEKQRERERESEREQRRVMFRCH